jgi:hypothetical protein
MPQCQFPVSAIFVFQKSYTGNILRIRRKKLEFLFFLIWDEVRRWDGGAPEGGHTTPWHGPILAAPWHGVVPWPTFWRCSSAYIFPSMGKPKRNDHFSTKPIVSRRHRRCEIGRVQKLFPAPCRRGESPPEAFFITMVASGVMCE